MMLRTSLRLTVALLVLATLPVTGLAVSDGAPDASGNAASQAACSFPVTLPDATGTDVTVQEEPRRIVTLGPASAQTLVELGADDRIVGASKYSGYLEGSSEWANVSGAGRAYVSVEKVIAQQPDLVLAENIVADETVEKLRDAGVTVYKFRKATSLEFVYQKVNRTGTLVGSRTEAARTVAEMKYEVRVAQKAAASGESPNALYSFYGYTAGENTYIDEIITAAGGTNVAAEAGLTGYPRISDETVANATIDWFVLDSSNPSVPQTAAYRNTRAYREDNLVALDTNYVSQPAPRIVRPIRTLAETWYPQAYADARESVEAPTDVEDPCAVQSTTSGTTSDGTTSDATTAGDSTTEPDGTVPLETPGFVAVAALLAIVAGVALFSRRD